MTELGYLKKTREKMLKNYNFCLIKWGYCLWLADFSRECLSVLTGLLSDREKENITSIVNWKTESCAEWQRKSEGPQLSWSDGLLLISDSYWFCCKWPLVVSLFHLKKKCYCEHSCWRLLFWSFAKKESCCLTPQSTCHGVLTVGC